MVLLPKQLGMVEGSISPFITLLSTTPKVTQPPTLAMLQQFAKSRAVSRLKSAFSFASTVYKSVIILYNRLQHSHRVDNTLFD